MDYRYGPVNCRVLNYVAYIRVRMERERTREREREREREKNKERERGAGGRETATYHGLADMYSMWLCCMVTFPCLFQ